MEAIFFVCAALLCAQAHCLSIFNPSSCSTPCQSQVVSATPVVATTIVDNSVSNSLANALQLLIVSNLIENTMGQACGCNALGSCGCDSIPIQTSVYSPALDFTPDYIPIPVSPCDMISPCDLSPPIIDVIPAVYPDILPISNGCGCGCDSPYIPNYGNCGCGMINNVGCGCGNGIPNFGCNGGLSSLLPTILGMSNLGCGCNGLGSCGCNNFGFDLNPFGPGGCGCDNYGPIVPEVVIPQVISAPSYGCGGGCGCGMPSYPVINAEPLCYDSCPNRYGNAYYVY